MVKVRPENYLEIAETVLCTARRPLSARAIMDVAYKARIVPSNLYGKTQHKTLQARLSEDILTKKSSSRFFRTEPGLFFLASLRDDPNIPESFKEPFYARRRSRELAKPEALAFDKAFLSSRSLRNLNWQELLKAADEADAIRHVDPKSADKNIVLVWAFSVVRRRNEILTYRVGRYRDQRDAFANRKSIGFSEMVSFTDATLFSDDMGVSECGLKALLDDLDPVRAAFSGEISKPTVSFAIIALRMKIEPIALFVLEWDCPDWFEPTSRRLSLNELRWMDASQRPNDIEAFEPWSAIALAALIDREQKHPNGTTADKTTGRVLKI